MTELRKPIQRTVLLGCIVLVALICVLFTALAYSLFTQSLYHHYNQELTHIIDYVEERTDVDELRECRDTGVESAKYKVYREFLNRTVDTFDIDYLYIIDPFSAGEGVMRSIASATSAEEFAAGAEDVPLVFVSDDYPTDVLKLYQQAWNRGGYSFFEEDSGWGEEYTGCKALKASDGETIGLLCVDIPIATVHREMRMFFVAFIVLALVIGVISAVIALWWLRRNVTNPIQSLEKSARDFADKSHRSMQGDLPDFAMPDIHTGNEVESLAEAIKTMSDNMHDYVTDILHAEERATSAEREAYQDPLTGAGSKIAHDAFLTDIEAEMERGTAQPFAVIMLDLNNLKGVNDSYGHEHGDEYIVAACDIMSNSLEHSRVFRIGGDEFVAVLRGPDYEQCDQLVALIESDIDKLVQNDDLEPWQRASAAVGTAKYNPDQDKSFSQVFTRADMNMYAHKKAMKGEA